MFLAEDREKELIGLQSLIAKYPCLSPQGRDLQASFPFYSSRKKEALEREFQILDCLRKSLAEDAGGFAGTERLLRAFRSVRLSLKGLEENRTLEQTEFFEIKRFIRLSERLRRESPLLAPAAVKLLDLAPAFSLLNPQGAEENGFYIYSSYSSELMAIRQEKKELERQILTASREKQQKLLEERTSLSRKEGEEERQVLKELSQKLQDFVAPMKENSRAIAWLDYRMVRAKLGELWQAGTPVFRKPGEGVRMVDAFEPQLAEELAKKDDSFTRQSIRMLPGASIITGANMGGKSVALQTLLLQVLLVHYAYYPACRQLETEVFDAFAYATENPGERSLGLSSFGMEAAKIREYLKLTETRRLFLVLDEPARGTNPREAEAIVTGLCRYFAKSPSYLLLASHYQIPPGEGIAHFRIRGLIADTLHLSNTFPEQEKTSYKERRQYDLAAAKTIRKHMDYRLMETDGKRPIPAEAIRIAEWMGVNKEAISLMRQAYKEKNEWQE